MTIALRVVIAVACLLFGLAGPLRADAPVAAPVPPELVDALKSLKKADSDARQKVYTLLGEKGDARLVPALNAYKSGTLLVTDDKLLTFGERTTVDGASKIPVIDAITGQLSPGPDGKPIYLDKPKLTDAIRTPRGADRDAVLDLIDALSLLHPDPTIRTASIRSAGERAAQAVPDPADSGQFFEALATCTAALNARLARAPQGADAPTINDAIAAIAAAKNDKPKALLDPTPSAATAGIIKSKLRAVADAVKAQGIDDKPLSDALTTTLYASTTYVDQAEKRKKVLEDLPKTGAALKRQLAKEPTGAFAGPLKEAIASVDVVTGDEATRIAAAKVLGDTATSRAANLLNKIASAAERIGDAPLHDAASSALSSANSYQMKVHFIQNSFAGLSLGSILVLLALGLSIIFGLMGVINMAQGEFMMVGAFTTLVVANFFHAHLSSSAYSYYLIAAVPAAFLVTGLVGFIAEWLVIRHLYGRPLETLLATWGIGLVLIFVVRKYFGDNVSIAPPGWMEGGWEVAPDIVFPLNRVYIILFCAICIAIVYFVVNGTKLGLLLRATTQNREMASALGVPTRRIDGLTFAFGAGLAGLAGVAVPLYDKINPDMGQSYIVDCFMVVVVGGVGKVAGAIWAGLGLGFIGKYLEPILGSIPMFASGSSVIGKVLVLGLIIAFLQKRPQGLFPPRGRNVDA